MFLVPVHPKRTIRESTLFGNEVLTQMCFEKEGGCYVPEARAVYIGP